MYYIFNSGFCIVTFNEHTASISDLCFVGSGHALLSSSLDGTIRCFDIVRYRNFRTFVAPEPVQFSCVSCDSYYKYNLIDQVKLLQQVQQIIFIFMFGQLKHLNY